MVVEERLKSKILYKIELFLLKIIPMLMAVCSACNSILSYFDIEITIINYIGGVSLLPLIFLYMFIALYLYMNRKKKNNK